MKDFEDYRNSERGIKSVSEMEKHGMKHPYIENVLKTAFEAGSASKEEFYRPFFKWILRHKANWFNRAVMPEEARKHIKIQLGLKV